MKHVWVVLSSIALCACDDAVGTDDGSTGSMSTGSSMTPGKQIGLSVGSAKRVHTIGVLTAAPNKEYLVLQVTLTNVDVSAGIPEDVLFYSVDLASNTSLQASGASAALPDYCDAALRVNPGGMATCSVAFELPKTENPTTVRYRDPIEMVTASATIPAPLPPPGSGCEAGCAVLGALTAELKCSEPTEQECLTNCMDVYVAYPSCTAKFDVAYACYSTLTASDCSCAPWLEFSACKDESSDAQACISM
ncbi:MAG: hypothetical protein U0414_39535 [Polyangiaceae bacterium]